MTDSIVVYRRPGCPYCVRLERQLAQSRLPVRALDIWADPEAAAFVRRHANGNETVPTVVVGDQVLVNPSARTVLALAADAGIVAPAGAPDPGRASRLRRRPR